MPAVAMYRERLERIVLRNRIELAAKREAAAFDPIEPRHHGTRSIGARVLPCAGPRAEDGQSVRPGLQVEGADRAAEPRQHLDDGIGVLELQPLRHPHLRPLSLDGYRVRYVTSYGQPARLRRHGGGRRTRSGRYIEPGGRSPARCGPFTENALGTEVRMRLIQFRDAAGNRAVAAITDGGGPRVVRAATSVRDLALEAHRAGRSLSETVKAHGLGAPVDYDALIKERRVLVPLDHP